MRVDGNAFSCRFPHEYFPAAVKTHHRRGQDLADRIRNQRGDAITPYRNKAIGRTEVDSNDHGGATLSHTGHKARRGKRRLRRVERCDAAPGSLRDAVLDVAKQECRDDRPHPKQDCRISERGLVGNEAALYLLAALHYLRVATEQILGKQRVPEQKAE